ncbi:50S ribosomal protein L4 [Ralstonia sp.]|uniref:50S ribosomal protein L4 n=1 Tax=Ralstonia sp. TaxID=54061 RepID=UPI001A3E0539|nr:50S ribosomal protein L4 [Ralstonia sp.]MBL4777716.1 50S ribosomal protein L4 [Ralstonia sp.]
MKLKVCNLSGNEKGEIELGFTPIENRKGTQVVHDVVVAYRAAQRSGTACTKTRGEISFSNRKPWRQKGTGRARAGTASSPIWRGGGVAFGPKPRDYDKKVNRKARRLAFKKAVSARILSGDVIVVDDLKLETHRTKEMVGILKTLKVSGSVLIVVSKVERNMALSARNIAHLELATSDSANVYEILKSDFLIFTQSALEDISQRVN